MKERILTKEEQILVFETRIEERKLIICGIESSLADVNWNTVYKQALKDEVQNHNLYIQEYQEELNKLKQYV